MNNKKIKTLKIVMITLLSISLLAGCIKPRVVKNYSGKPPVQSYSVDDANLNFTTLHNYVIDSLLSQMTPFFYIKDNTLEISGTNGNYKTIKISAVCSNGTVRHDLDLFLSLVLYYIGEGASLQFDVYKIPNVDSEGNHLDFGTVFNEYSLDFNFTCEDGSVLLKEVIEAGDEIPVDPKYWSEENG